MEQPVKATTGTLYDGLKHQNVRHELRPAKLMSEGKLHPDDRIAKYIPGLPIVQMTPSKAKHAADF